MTAFEAEIAARRTASLEEVDSAASLQTRTDRKYVVELDAVDSFVSTFGGWVLEIDGRRHFEYETTYFDTEGFDLYLDAARRRPRRLKARVRRYVDSGLVMLEVKTKDGRGRTEKLRRRHVGPLTDVGDAMRGFVSDIADDQVAADLVPTLATTFQRTTLLDTDRSARYTIDRSLRGTRPGGAHVDLDAAVVETKSSGRATGFDRWLWAHNTRPAKISKYCTMLAALEPDLPSNHWHRTLCHHFVESQPTL